MKPLRRIGLFGGSFDPVHQGHMRMATLALEKCRLDTVIFIPAQQPPHKHPKKLTSACHRVAMLTLALQRHKHFQLNRYELDRPGTTYSYQTVRHFARTYPAARLFFIMGSDSFAELHTWHRHELLLRGCTPIIIQRTPVSSSEIRQRLERGMPITRLVPPAVEKYIKKNNLYESHCQLS
jgi:nicotinate-nucleotide adenylyltransferase